jgi:radical SAM protein with 4Fe4S-binding SPASM domain
MDAIVDPLETGPASALLVEITSHCNLKCKMCPLTAQITTSGLRPGHMQAELLGKIIPFAQEAGQVGIAGYGEPLTHPDCVQFLQELDSLGVRTNITTNGTLLTKSVSEELAALQHLAGVNISIDSPDPKIYREIRGGNLEKALEGVRNLTAVIDDPSKVTVSSVMMNTNIESLVAFPGLLSKLGVEKYVLQGLIDYNPGLENEDLLRQNGPSSHLDKIKQACADTGIELILTLPEHVAAELASASDTPGKQAIPPESKARQCCLPWEIPVIDRNGQVFPCCYAESNSTAVLGDLNQASLQSIWQGEKYREFRQNILDGRTTPAICQRCTLVPSGVHPLRLYSAMILREKSEIGATHARLCVQNTGTCTWTHDNPVLIGTSNPRSRTSAYFCPSWLSSDRVAAFIENRVPPGSTATFEFQIAPSAEVLAESFELLVEGKCWLPNTRFELSPGGKAHPGPYSAKILYDKSVLRNQINMRLAVQNTGQCTWTQDNPVLIGTTRPRDHASPYSRLSWLSHNRITSFTEESVPPGETATFEFQIRPSKSTLFDTFQLVAKGADWLPNTQFQLRPGNTTENRLIALGYSLGHKVIEILFHLLGHTAGDRIVKTLFKIRKLDRE